MPNPQKLGRIKKVDLRKIFPDEAGDFTPWLEHHIDEIAETIGIEITDIKREAGVGSFSCDLIGTEVNSDDKVIIENQLAQTDHTHLGQIITYASGVGAKYVVWVAKKIREEHQKALEWLNENANGISFFGIEVSAISIDDSSPAVSFRLLVEPNEWEKEVKSVTDQVDERHRKYQQFFTRLVDEYGKTKKEWRQLMPRPESWLGFGAGRTGFNFNWAFGGDNQFKTELYIDTKDKDEVKNYFNGLMQSRGEIEKMIPGLHWEELPDRRASRIALYNKMPTTIKLMNDKQIDAMVEKAIDQMALFKRVLTPYIQNLEK